MASSNKSLRKVRTRTFVSIILFLLILGGFSYLYLEISKQSVLYGDVKSNLDRYTADLANKKQEFDEISSLLSEKNTLLSKTNLELIK